MSPSRPIPVAIHSCSRCVVSRRPAVAAPALENQGNSPAAVLHLIPPPAVRGSFLDFHNFDQPYLDLLRAGDYRAQDHFFAYFSALIQIKLRSRLKSPEAIEDIRQETFSRFLLALREGKIQQPERLGSFVNSICNHVLLEHYRADSRTTPIDDGEGEPRDFPDKRVDLLTLLTAKETEKKVREILEQLSERDRRLLREVFLEEKDKDEVCRDFGIDRNYLRVLLHRAKQAFKALYKKDNGDDEPDGPAMALSA